MQEKPNNVSVNEQKIVQLQALMMKLKTEEENIVKLDLKLFEEILNLSRWQHTLQELTSQRKALEESVDIQTNLKNTLNSHTGALSEVNNNIFFVLYTSLNGFNNLIL